MTTTPARHRDTYDPGPDEFDTGPNLADVQEAGDDWWATRCEVRKCDGTRVDGHYCARHGGRW